MKSFVACVLYVGVLAGMAGTPAAHAQNPTPAQWLERMSRAARELPYTGVFVHQTMDGSSTSRITHMLDKQGNEHEKIEVLDGPLMEIVRRNEELFCYQPDQKTVRVDRRSTGRFFPSLVAGDAAALNEGYRVKLGSVERVAGHDCQWVMLEPRDAMRYMQKLCAELGTGLLIKARTYNERHQMLEQFMFTQLDVTDTVAKSPPKSRYEQSKGWLREQQLRLSQAMNDTGWLVGNLPNGFRKVSEMFRNLAGRKEPVAHLVFSDGLSHVSVFIEPAAGTSIQPSARVADDSSLAFAVRPVAEYQVTVVGEVPVLAVQTIAEGVARRNR